MAELEPYEAFYYGGQTQGRGLLTPEALIKSFESAAHHYDELFGDSLDHLREHPALELACGYGNFLYYLRKRGWTKSEGVDLDPAQVALARSLDLPARHGDALGALEGAEKLGAVSAFDLIEHLDKNDVVKLVQDARDALVPGGVLILQAPCADGFRGAYDFCNDLTHRWAPTSVVMWQLLKTAGFSRVDIIDLTLPPYPDRQNRFRYALRKLARRLVRPFLAVLGVGSPVIWSNSQLAIAWK